MVESDAFSEVWATATRAAHRALVGVSTSDGGGLVVRTDEGVGIQLGAVVERVKQTLTDRGLGAAQLIPTIDKVIILGDGQNLATIRTGYALATALGFWLPFITLGLFALGILIARRRSVAVLGTGIGFVVGAGTLAASIGIGTSFVGIIANSLGLSPDALNVIYEQVIGNISQTAVVLTFLGVLIAIVGWLMGRSRPAKGLRSAFDSLNASGRRELATRGLDTGAFGLWLGKQRILVRAIIAVLAVLWLFALRPLSVGDILLVVVVSFAVAWILELLQRRPDELALIAAGVDPDAVVVEETVIVVEEDSPTVEIIPADEAPTLDLTSDADAATEAGAASAKGKSPKR